MTVHWKRSAIGLVLGAASLIALANAVPAADTAPPQASVTVISGGTVRGVLGRMVQGANGKDMGRVVDVIVDPAGQVRAAIVDFGGFLGVGSRKIAVDWNALHFREAVKDGGPLKLELAQDQLKAAPEYKEGQALVVIGSTGALEPLNFPKSPQEK